MPLRGAMVGAAAGAAGILGATQVAPRLVKDAGGAYAWAIGIGLAAIVGFGLAYALSRGHRK